MRNLRDERKDFSWDISRKCLNPLVQVREGDEEVTVTADLPCVDKEDIDLTVEKRSLKIKAAMKRKVRFKRWGGVHRKISFNSFRKNVPLPAEVIPEKSEAKFKNGVLRINLKKKRGKKIDIE